MLTLPKILHLEVTDVCQAACPQCAREIDKLFDKKTQNHLTIEKIVSTLDPTTIKQLDKMFMCGNYGDPAAGKHTINIYEYFRKINPTITLGMNTNGGINNTGWWQRLAKILNKSTDYVVFSIDGLEDTNHIYRQNVLWNKVMDNAQAYIQAGGSAHWDMLVFEHNKHQVDECQQLAKDIGFRYFRAKVSRRHNEFPISFLQHPQGWEQPNVEVKKIQCLALKERSLYMNAKGTVYPCCWLGTPTGADISQFADIQKNWTVNPNPVCQTTCGTNSSAKNSFTNQWQREIKLV